MGGVGSGIKKGSHWRVRHPHRDHLWRMTDLGYDLYGQWRAAGVCVIEGCHTARRFDKGQWDACKRLGNVVEQEQEHEPRREEQA